MPAVVWASSPINLHLEVRLFWRSYRVEKSVGASLWWGKVMLSRSLIGATGLDMTCPIATTLARRPQHYGDPLNRCHATADRNTPCP
eukprot:6328340-Amphidinium_carterae.1